MSLTDRVEKLVPAGDHAHGGLAQRIERDGFHSPRIEQPDLWRRYLVLLFDGLRARPDTTPLPLQAPPHDAMHLLMCSLQGRRT